MMTTIAILVVFLAGQSPTPVVDDGIYRHDPSASRVVATALGEDVGIGQPYDTEIHVANVNAIDNGNTRFYASIQVPFDADVVSPFWAVLVVDGVAYPQHSGGSAGEHTSMLDFVVDGRAGAEAIATFFGIAPTLRHHPSHRLHIKFRPTQATYTTGDAVTVTLRLTNVGDEPVAFMQGGRNRASRDNQYVFSARRGVRHVADIGSSMHFGGLAGRRVIAPGQTFEDTVDLTKWFAFDTPGHYDVLGSYFMSFGDPNDRGDSRTFWEDYATAPFSLQIDG